MPRTFFTAGWNLGRAFLAWPAVGDALREQLIAECQAIIAAAATMGASEIVHAGPLVASDADSPATQALSDALVAGSEIPIRVTTDAATNDPSLPGQPLPLWTDVSLPEPSMVGYVRDGDDGIAEPLRVLPQTRLWSPTIAAETADDALPAFLASRPIGTPSMLVEIRLEGAQPVTRRALLNRVLRRWEQAGEIRAGRLDDANATWIAPGPDWCRDWPHGPVRLAAERLVEAANNGEPDALAAVEVLADAYLAHAETGGAR